MSLMDAPSGERIYIGFFGKTNAGKSSLVNAITNQNMSVVSEVKGTTTDAVYKNMELLPLGPVTIVDTPGFDDDGTLGNIRIAQTKKVLNKIDIAVLVCEPKDKENEYNKILINTFVQKDIPYIVAYNKSDVFYTIPLKDNEISVSAKTLYNIDNLKLKIAELTSVKNTKKIVSDLIKKDDVIILVTPIDESAPKGRIILPQQQTIRDILDADAISITVKETELENTLKILKEKPNLVITDSQVFEYVSNVLPKDIPLTSFSILMARYKGFLKTAVDGVSKIDCLKDGDIVLIAEGCTHHRQCNDIGTVKIPNWLKKYTGKNLIFETVSSSDFPDDLSKYSLILQCGGCMLNQREILYRMKEAKDSCVPITNYGTAISYINGILKRSVEIFKDINL